jgi:hypothetical protein
MSHRRNNAVMLIESRRVRAGRFGGICHAESLLPPLPSGAIMKAR